MNPGLPGESPVLEIPRGAADPLQKIAAYAREASTRRGLTVGELADDLEENLSAMGEVGRVPAPGQPAPRLYDARRFLEILVRPFFSAAVKVHVDCDEALQLRADELATIGMVASEAISNAMRHGFPDARDGRIWLRLAQEEGRIRLTIRDNGVGMPDLDPAPFSGGGLIDALARRLGGYARLGSAPFGGAMASVIYPRA